MISDCSTSAVSWMQALSEPRVGAFINHNLSDMQGLYVTSAPLLTFRRISPILERDWLERELGSEFAMSRRAVERLRELDWAQADNLKSLYRIGAAMAQKEHWLSAEDFPARFDIPSMTQSVPSS